MDDCVFCKIVAGKIPSNKVFADDYVYAFRDAHPQAPVHVLIVPKKHYDSLNEVPEEQENLMGHMLITARNIAKQEGIEKRGYRVAVNTGPEAGQVVMHLHMHLLGGRHLTGELG